MSDDKQRAMMAAHLTEESGLMFRHGRTKDASLLALLAGNLREMPDSAERAYRQALEHRAGLTPEQIDAAVASIERHEWPADSLAGLVTKMRDKAEQVIEDNRPVVNERARTAGAIVFRLNKVLEILGVKL